LRAQLEEREDEELAALHARHAEMAKAADERSAHLALEREHALQQKLEAAAAAAKAETHADVDDAELARLHRLRDEAHAAVEARKTALAREKHARAAELHEEELRLHATLHRNAESAKHALSHAVKERRERDTAARNAAHAKRDDAVREKRLASWTERAEIHNTAEEERQAQACCAFHHANTERAATVARAAHIAAAKAERHAAARLGALGEAALLAGVRLLREREAALKQLMVQEARAAHQVHILRIRHLRSIPFDARKAHGALKIDATAVEKPAFQRSATSLSAAPKPAVNFLRKNGGAARGQVRAPQSADQSRQAPVRRHVDPQARAFGRATTAKLKLD
jgi:hypothetical protein